MTTDKDNQRVSDAYRGIATQTTSPELDQRILELAASGTRSRYGLARAWVRPLAWAATIALSLALVLEFTREVEAPLDVAPEPAPTMDERSRQDADFSDAGLSKVEEAKELQNGTSKRALEARPEAAAPATLGAQDMAPLREAEERMMLQSADAPAACDTEARATAASWYACIADLREQGRAEEAAMELETFRRAYPDYVETPE